MEIELDDIVVVQRTGDGAVKLHRPSLGGGLIFFVPLLGRAIGGATGAARDYAIRSGGVRGAVGRGGRLRAGARGDRG